jgi:ubiquinone/menaquinone biosynthesis C-methylase UbiE
MACHGGFSLDEATRRTWYNPEEILKKAGLDKGMVFIDIGCGEGFFSILAAKIVGETGTIYAVDTDEQGIDRLNTKAKEQKLQNIKTTVGMAEKTVFCKECADVIFYSMVLHDFKDPAQVLWNAKKMLKHTGTLWNLDWKKIQMPFGPPFKIRFSEQDTQGLLKMAGFTVNTVKDAGPYHYVISAKPNNKC